MINNNSMEVNLVNDNDEPSWLNNDTVPLPTDVTRISSSGNNNEESLNEEKTPSKLARSPITEKTVINIQENDDDVYQICGCQIDPVLVRV